MDYLFYSVVQGKGVPNGQVGTCADTCGQGIFKQKCCASLTASRGNQSDVWYACVDQSLAAADMTMNIMGNSVNVTCVQSGAMRIAGVTMAAALALVSTM